MQELERLWEEEVRVDENDLDLVQQAGLGYGVEDHAVAGDERRGEDGVLLLLSETAAAAAEDTNSNAMRRAFRDVV